jgi:hypothetical protein
MGNYSSTRDCGRKTNSQFHHYKNQNESQLFFQKESVALDFCQVQKRLATGEFRPKWGHAGRLRSPELTLSPLDKRKTAVNNSPFG